MKSKDALGPSTSIHPMSMLITMIGSLTVQTFFDSSIHTDHFGNVARFPACEIRECHGNTELYQCAGTRTLNTNIHSNKMQ